MSANTNVSHVGDKASSFIILHDENNNVKRVKKSKSFVRNEQNKSDEADVKIYKKLSFIGNKNGEHHQMKSIKLLGDERTPAIEVAPPSNMNTMNASCYFSFNPLACHFNTIEKSLMKRRVETQDESLDDLKLYSVELDSPVKKNPVRTNQISETPLLISKLNRDQIRINRVSREFSILIGNAENPNSGTSFEISFLNNTNSILYIDQDFFENNSQNVTQIQANEIERAGLAPPNAPNCIQSIVLMIKSIFTPKHQMPANHI